MTGILKKLATFVAVMMLAFSVNAEDAKQESTGISLALPKFEKGSAETPENILVSLHFLYLRVSNEFDFFDRITGPEAFVTKRYEGYYSKGDIEKRINGKRLALAVYQLYMDALHDEYLISTLNAEAQKTRKENIANIEQEQVYSLMALHNGLLKKDDKGLFSARYFNGTSQDIDEVKAYINSVKLTAEEVDTLMRKFFNEFKNYALVARLRMDGKSLNVNLIENKTLRNIAGYYTEDQIGFFGAFDSLILESMYQQSLDSDSVYYKASQQRVALLNKYLAHYTKNNG
jgi:hypothetical protein